jgi:hypothetical protein
MSGKFRRMCKQKYVHVVGASDMGVPCALDMWHMSEEVMPVGLEMGLTKAFYKT